jgi:hypothetical protein
VTNRACAGTRPGRGRGVCAQTPDMQGKARTPPRSLGAPAPADLRFAAKRPQLRFPSVPCRPPTTWADHKRGESPSRLTAGSARSGCAARHRGERSRGSSGARAVLARALGWGCALKGLPYDRKSAHPPSAGGAARRRASRGSGAGGAAGRARSSSEERARRRTHLTGDMFVARLARGVVRDGDRRNGHDCAQPLPCVRAARGGRRSRWRGWTAFAVTMTVKRCPPPGEPGDVRRRTPQASRLWADSAPLGALRRAAPPALTANDEKCTLGGAYFATRRESPTPGHLSPPVGGARPATGNDRWSRPANARPDTTHAEGRWPSICGHRQRGWGIGQKQTRRRDVHRPTVIGAPTGARRGRRDAGTATTADWVGPGARPTNTGAKP